MKQWNKLSWMGAAIVMMSGLSAQANFSAPQQVRNLFEAMDKAQNTLEFEAAFHGLSGVLSRVDIADQNSQELCSTLKSQDIGGLFLIENDLIQMDRKLINRQDDNAKTLSRCVQDLRLRLAMSRAQDTNSATRAASVKKVRFKTVEISAKPDVYRFMDLGEREVVLTFDDGPNPATTPQVLDILDRAGVKAVFFSVGNNAMTNPSITQRILREGHGLGSHSFFHTLAMGCKLKKGQLSQNYVLSEIAKGHTGVLSSAGGADPFFRFPNGSSTKTLVTNVKEMGMSVWDWAVDTEDWRNAKRANPTEATLAKMKADFRASYIPREKWDRGVVLFHDIWQQTANALPTILNWLADNDFTVVLPVHPRRAEVAFPATLPSFFQPVLNDINNNGKKYASNIFGILPNLSRDPLAKNVKTAWASPDDMCWK